MNLFLYRPSYEAHGAALRAVCPDAGFCVLEPDGTVTLIDTEDPAFDVAWGSFELYNRPDTPIQTFMGQVLGCERCRWFQTASAGVEHPVFRAIVDRGITLTNSPATAPAIAEYVLAHVLTGLQPIAAYADAQAQQRWQRLPFRELGDCSVLIVGFGNIGQAVGRRCRAFGARVTGVRRTPGAQPDADRMITPDALPDALTEADVVVLALAVGPDSEKLVDDAFLERLAPDAVLVNVSRGAVIDEAALLRGLTRGQPDRAVLDVFATEPLPQDSPLWRAPNVTVTPHASAHSAGTVRRGTEVFAANLARFLTGDPLAHQVPKAYLAPSQRRDGT